MRPPPIMEMHRNMLFSALVLACVLTPTTAAITDSFTAPSVPTTETHSNGRASTRRTYIVRVRPAANSYVLTRHEDLESYYKSFLPPTMATSSTRPLLVHAYSKAISGFATNLTDKEAEYVSRKDNVLQLYPDRLLPLQTTHTPDFLELRTKNGVWDSVSMGDGIIIGIMDTGIDSEHASFHDDGMRVPPEKWRGSCKFKNFVCNNKVIGAKSFTSFLPYPPVDCLGHGTHTASTAAGNMVEGANVLGSGKGTAAGMAPRAHLAIYQVCTAAGCFTSHLIAGMDAAISDGVDVISLSLGGASLPFYDDVIAIGAFAATQKGIFVSCAASNGGPDPGSLSNEAPWVLTVGASTTDRRMNAIVKLGDGRIFAGESAYQLNDLPFAPLLYPPLTSDLSFTGNCFNNLAGASGKVVACERPPGDIVTIGKKVKTAGSVGMILLGNEQSGHTTLAQAHVLPASYVDYSAAMAIKKYANSSGNPTAAITFTGTSLGTSSSPVVAYFSSRGPSTASPGILKPDIIGPGVNIIAAWPSKFWPSLGGGGMTFNAVSGTSMSTPHLSGIAALIKSAHPEWSPAAIKSAIMTTAYVECQDGKPIMDEKLSPAGIFSIGAGHVNPLKAINPGLIYDIEEAHYIAYICGLGYSDSQVEAITHQTNPCGNTSRITEAELNYPSIAVRATTGKLVVNRTVTNVGEATAKYIVDVSVRKDVKASVSPTVLEFAQANEKRSFTVSLSWDPSKIKHAEGSFKWVSDKHVVRSPFVIFTEVVS